jgi:hypothetical protein
MESFFAIFCEQLFGICEEYFFFLRKVECFFNYHKFSVIISDDFLGKLRGLEGTEIEIASF